MMNSAQALVLQAMLMTANRRLYHAAPINHLYSFCTQYCFILYTQFNAYQQISIHSTCSFSLRVANINNVRNNNYYTAETAVACA